MCISTRTIMRDGGLFAPDTSREPLMEAARVTHALLTRAGSAGVYVHVQRSGLAAPEGWAILRGGHRSIRLWVGACDYAGLIATIAHEVAHIAFPPVANDPAHGHHAGFWRGLVELVRDAYDLDVAAPVAGETAHACDERIEAALISRYPWAAAPVPGYGNSVRLALLEHAALNAREQQGAITWADLRRIVYEPAGTPIEVVIWTARGPVAWRLRIPRVADTVRLEHGETMIESVFRQRVNGDPPAHARARRIRGPHRSVSVPALGPRDSRVP